MDTLNYDYKFTIMDGKNWLIPNIPLKIITLDLSHNDFAIKYIDIIMNGNFNEKTKKILSKIQENVDVKIDNNEKNTLKSYYGEHYAEILGLNYINPQEFAGGAYDDEDIDIDFGDDDYEEEEEEEEIDMGRQSSTKKSETRKNVVNFNFDLLITSDNTVDEIMHMISYLTNIPTIFQHTFMKIKDDLYRTLNYNVKYTDKLDKYYDINLFSLLDNIKEKTLVSGIPVDEKFNSLFNSDDIHIYDNKYKLMYNIINSYYNLDNCNTIKSIKEKIDTLTFYTCDIHTIISQKVDMVDFGEMIKSQGGNYELFHQGFILKYFPSIIDRTAIDDVINNNRDKFLLKNSEKFINTWKFNNKLQTMIADVSKKQVEDFFDIQQSIVTMTISINDNVANYLNKNILDTRVLYEYLHVDDNVIYIEYRRGKTKYMKISKAHENMLKNITAKKDIPRKSRTKSRRKTTKIRSSKKDVEIEEIEMKEGLEFKELEENNPLEIRLRYYSEILGYYKIILLSKITNKGKMTLQISWTEKELANFQNLTKEIFPITNNFIEKINNFGDQVLISGLPLEKISKYNVLIRMMNMTIFNNLKDNSIENIDKIFVNPIKLPALVELFSYYFNPSQIFIHHSQDEDLSLETKVRKAPDFKTLTKRMQNEMTYLPRKMNVSKYTVTFKQKDEFIKLSIKAKRDITYIHNLYNFLSRFLIIYKDINCDNYQLLKSEEITQTLKKLESKWQETNKEYLKFTTPYSKRKKILKPTYKNISEFVNNDIPFKKVNLLKETDPELFDYDHLIREEAKRTGKKPLIKPYSRLCQNLQQPVPMTDEELKKIKKPYTYHISYPNKTHAGEKINYVCLGKTHQYPGFTNSNKDHPREYCLLCCRKMDYLKAKKGTAYKRYLECKNKKPTTFLTNKRLVQNRKYIKGYGKIGPDRYSWLPEPLMKLLNASEWSMQSIGGAKNSENSQSNNKENNGCKMCGKIDNLNTSIIDGGSIIFKNNCQVDKVKVVDKFSANCYLLYGILQSNMSFITAVEQILQMRYGTLLDILIEKLKENPSKFETLENGEIKIKFSTMDNYIEFLKNPENNITEEYAEDLVKIFNPVYEKLNIIIFNDNRGQINLIDKLSPEILSDNLRNSKYKTIILVKSKRNYYILMRGDNDVFSSTSPIIDILVAMLQITISKSIGENSANKSKFDYSVQYEFNTFAEFFTKYAISTKKYPKAKIIREHIVKTGNEPNTINTTVSVGISINGDDVVDIILPVYPSASGNYDVLEKYEYCDFAIVLDYLVDFYRILAGVNFISLSELQIDGDDNIIGIVLPNGREIYVKLISIHDKFIGKIFGKKKILTTFKSYTIVNYNPANVDENIIKKEREIDQRIKNADIIKYNNEIHNILLLEFNNLLFTQKNEDIRKNIIALVKNDPKLINKLEIDEYDMKDLKKIIDIANYNTRLRSDKSVFMNEFNHLFDKFIFDFDLTALYELKNYLAIFTSKKYKKANTKKQNRLIKVKLIEDIRNILKIAFDKIINIVDEDFFAKDKNKPTPPKKMRNPMPPNIKTMCFDKINRDKCNNVNILNQQQCAWVENSKCKIVMGKINYDYHLNRLLEELLKNETKRSNLLDIKQDNVDNLNVFSYNPEIEKQIIE